MEKILKAIPQKLEPTGLFLTDAERQHIAETLHKADITAKICGKNIAEAHPVDEFVCSNCGICLMEWCRVVIDEESGDEFYYEYEFKHCPECGMEVTNNG